VGFLKNLSYYKNKNVLLLQGPKGPFFWRLAKDLKKAGAKVFKINFNGGDLLFYPIGAVNFRGSLNDWEKFIKNFYERNKIDIVLLFSDVKPLHKIAINVAKEKGIEVGVFEEGYIRPDYVTFEPSGVNGNSVFAKLAEKNVSVYDLPVPNCRVNPPQKVGNTFWHEVLWAILYYLASDIFRPLFPKYEHHIELYFPKSLLKLGIPWLVAGLKKPFQSWQARRIQKLLTSTLKGKYFLVPLQVHNDSQVVLYSPFEDVRDFIRSVITSFSKHAPEDFFLVFKHHPRDRAFRNYSNLIKTLASEYKVKDRIFYIYDGHLPTLIDNSAGVVVINSSVGFQALNHGKPVAVLGTAVYAFPDLVFKNLDEFWQEAPSTSVDLKAVSLLRRLILIYCQINGSLHKKVSKESYSGLRWENSDVTECKNFAKRLQEVLTNDFKAIEC